MSGDVPPVRHARGRGPRRGHASGCCRRPTRSRSRAGASPTAPASAGSAPTAARTSPSSRSPPTMTGRSPARRGAFAPARSSPTSATRRRARLEAKNTHPFEQDGRLLAHNGMVGDLDVLERELGRDLRRVHGDTDSERVFALITREIERLGDVGDGITSAARWIAANLQMLAINLILIDATDLWALRYPDVHDLFVLERAAGGSARPRPRRPHPRHLRGARRAPRGDRRHRADGRRPGLAAARLRRAAARRRRAHGRAPGRRSRCRPTRPLTLADLEGHAAAAQRG